MSDAWFEEWKKRKGKPLSVRWMSGLLIIEGTDQSDRPLSLCLYEKDVPRLLDALTRATDALQEPR